MSQSAPLRPLLSLLLLVSLLTLPLSLLELAEQAVFQIAENRLKDSGPEKAAPLLAKAVEKVEFCAKTRVPSPVKRRASLTLIV